MGFRWLASLVALSFCLAAVDATSVAIFGFGDSYADTGNREAAADSWKVPYGITWPGPPGGRWCDGHLATDLLAVLLGLPSPTPYIKVGDKPNSNTKSGINFALGSTGVFKTTAPALADLAQQVDNFNSTITRRFYNPLTLALSVALVSVSGNDYAAWDGQGAEAFVAGVVGHLKEALVRLIALGVGHIIVPNLPPFDCHPTSTWTVNYTQCTNLYWGLVDYHNSLLADVVKELDQKSVITRLLLLDQFTGFSDAMNEFPYPLRPCCKGVDDLTTFCSSVASNGDIAYTLCDDPTTHFFFDTVHPSQTGWRVLITRYLEKPGYLVHYPTLTLREYWIRNGILTPWPKSGRVKKGRRSAIKVLPIPGAASAAV